LAWPASAFSIFLAALLPFMLLYTASSTKMKTTSAVTAMAGRKDRKSWKT
jgi:hypothetical protein